MHRKLIATMRKSMINLCSKRIFDIRMVHTVASNDERQEMMNLWPSVVSDLTKNRHYHETPHISQWLKKILEYNVPNGKMTRARDLVNAYKQLVPPEQLTKEKIRLARIVGWCIEMTQSFLLMEDDIMDRSLTRRGKTCWYLQEDIGLSAIKDASFIEQMIYQLLRIHFRHESYYMDLIESFHEGIYRTAIGQHLDMSLTNIGKKPNLNLFTMDRYNNVSKYKTTYYTFILPVTLAKHLAGLKDNEEFRQVDKLLIEIGNFYQSQDDYLDCYGDSEITGKTGTDIQEGKCTWLIVTALQRANSQQRQILEECYGENNSEKVARVKKLYNELGMETIYSNHEIENYNLLQMNIQQNSPKILQDFLFTILNRAYRRIK